MQKNIYVFCDNWTNLLKEYIFVCQGRSYHMDMGQFPPPIGIAPAKHYNNGNILLGFCRKSLKFKTYVLKFWKIRLQTPFYSLKIALYSYFKINNLALP